MRQNKKRAIDYRSLADFRYEIRRFLNFSEQAAREAGIEPHQHQALLAIKGLTPEQKATIGALAERLQVQHHTAVELVNRLEKKKLIRRSRNGADRREVMLALTSRGKRVLAELTLVHRAELRSAGPVLLRALNGILAQGRSSSTKHIRATSGPHEGQRNGEREKVCEG
jgi:DNA-binding MarR family transcriptional regulator